MTDREPGTVAWRRLERRQVLEEPCALRIALPADLSAFVATELEMGGGDVAAEVRDGAA